MTNDQKIKLAKALKYKVRDFMNTETKKVRVVVFDVNGHNGVHVDEWEPAEKLITWGKENGII